MTKTKILTYNYKSSTLKRAAVRRAIKEVNAEYEHEHGADDIDNIQTIEKTAKTSSAPKKG